ncbi:MAG: hypothetical protein JW787_11545 [Sedimentisphaerales bacterium]|nr:hypothetical protein [Sedimentisphaerales bacterium]
MFRGQDARDTILFVRGSKYYQKRLLKERNILVELPPQEIKRPPDIQAVLSY